MTDTPDPPDNRDPPTNTRPHQHAQPRVRDGKGRFRRTSDAATRDARALEMFDAGYTYRKIARELGIDVHTAYDIVQNGIQSITQEPAAKARQRWLDRMENAYDMALEVAETEHVKVSEGKVVRVRVLDDDGQPIIIDHNASDGSPIYLEADLIDDGPVLAAIDRMERIARRVAAMEGYDAEQKLNLSGELTYEVKGVPDEDV